MPEKGAPLPLPRWNWTSPSCGKRHEEQPWKPENVLIQCWKCEVSNPPCFWEKRGGGRVSFKRSNTKNTELSPFHCACFPLVVVIFMGQPGCEGRLQRFGDREAEQERTHGEWGPWRGLGSATSTDERQSCCRDWTTHRKQGSQDKRLRSGAWTRTIKDVQLRALDKLGQRRTRSWLCIYLFADWNELLITSTVSCSLLLGMWNVSYTVFLF